MIRGNNFPSYKQQLYSAQQDFSILLSNEAEFEHYHNIIVLQEKDILCIMNEDTLQILNDYGETISTIPWPQQMSTIKLKQVFSSSYDNGTYFYITDSSENQAIYKLLSSLNNTFELVQISYIEGSNIYPLCVQQFNDEDFILIVADKTKKTIKSCLYKSNNPLTVVSITEIYNYSDNSLDYSFAFNAYGQFKIFFNKGKSSIEFSLNKDNVITKSVIPYSHNLPMGISSMNGGILQVHADYYGFPSYPQPSRRYKLENQNWVEDYSPPSNAIETATWYYTRGNYKLPFGGYDERVIWRIPDTFLGYTNDEMYNMIKHIIGNIPS